MVASSKMTPVSATTGLRQAVQSAVAGVGSGPTEMAEAQGQLRVWSGRRVPGPPDANAYLRYERIAGIIGVSAQRGTGGPPLGS